MCNIFKNCSDGLHCSDLPMLNQMGIRIGGIFEVPNYAAGSVQLSL